MLGENAECHFDIFLPRRYYSAERRPLCSFRSINGEVSASLNPLERRRFAFLSDSICIAIRVS